MKNTNLIKYIILQVLIIFSSLIYADSDKFFSSLDKLSNSHVNKIYQDKKGYIWICTENGLNVFDGSNFKTFYHQTGDSTSLNNNSVLTVLEDSQGNFWVGTDEGLQQFDRKKEQFHNFKFSFPYVTNFSYISCIIEDRKGNIWLSTSRAGAICIKAKTHQPVYYLPTNSNICSDKINVFFEDRFGNIWIGSQDNGISVLNVENHTITNYSYNSKDAKSLSSNKVFAINETPEGNIIVGTIDGGIDVFDYGSRSFTRNYIPSIEKVFTFMADGKSKLWIGTDGFGLKQFNWKTRTISTYESELTSLNLRSVKVHSIFKDQQGNIWVALFQKGVLMIPPKNKLFNNIGFNPFYQEKSIGNECILSVLENHTGDLWIGTDGDGIYRLDSKRNVTQHYQKNKLSANCVLTIFEDSKNKIWAGTYLYGLFCYIPQNDSFEKKELFDAGQDVKDINIINEDSDGNLWIGTNEKGLGIYNPETKKTSWFKYDLLKTSNQILSNTIHTILFGKDHLVWIGTSGAGLSCYNQLTNTFSDYTFENGKISNNSIYSVEEDRFGNIWVGTKNGLNFINKKSGQTTCYTEMDGLSNSSVYGIEIDKNNNLWISTCLGLSYFDVQTKAFSKYYISDGLINEEYRRGTHFKSKSGELFFGGINGISSFYPFKSQQVHPILNLVFTDLYIYNEQVKIGSAKNLILNKNIDFTNEIKLNHDIKSFTIGFAALEYNNTDKVIYEVKMEGFDNDWNTVSTGSHLATYTNLTPGKYTIKVRAHLPGTKYCERSLVIIITPPFWLTWWAKLFYIILILGALMYAYKIALKRIERKEEDALKLNESSIMQSKLQFFTDISHEIRTPLTLILTPIENLVKETADGKLRDTYKLINQNGHRILRLINQVMEMRKLDKGQVKLRTEETEVKTFFEEIIRSFNYIADEKEIALTLSIKDELPKVWIDQEKLDKVIFNVLSNAFKYTSKNGQISIKIDFNNSDLSIRIADSGEGIPKDLRELVFNRFYQIPNDNNINIMGTGIGLHLSRCLMEIHHGKIYIEDADGIGCVFVITLPLNNNYLQPSEMITEHVSRDLAMLIQPSLSPFLDNDDKLKLNTKKNKHKYKLLIVEDDNDIRDYISVILGEEYQIFNAANGRIGLEITIKERPDCVITDLMMPEMDGMELCQKIKTNENTCHIPVIILTAKTTMEQRVEGLQVGADSYIPKPFNMDHLKTRISKLIELRRMMKDKYEGKLEVKKEDVNIRSYDEVFLEKLEAIVKAQMADPELSVENISQKIGISRSQLQRKLKLLTNQNPSDYIKTTRLRHAAWLLTSINISISEVTYATGFSSLSHFSNSFKEFYGMSPTRYIEINKQNKEPE